MLVNYLGRRRAMLEESLDEMEYIATSSSAYGMFHKPDSLSPAMMGLLVFCRPFASSLLEPHQFPLRPEILPDVSSTQTRAGRSVKDAETVLLYVRETCFDDWSALLSSF